MNNPIEQADANAALTRLPTMWRWRPSEPERVRALIRRTGMPPLMARILAARGLGDAEEARRFLSPVLGQLHDPFLMTDMEAAVDRICRALDRGEPIWIYGDYDVDGITATTILLLSLRELGCPADYYIPHRLSEGYGLNREAVDQLAQSGARLLITVDCGITSFAEAGRARQLGLDLIVSDHHEAEAQLPEACAVLNPKRTDCAYPCKVLSGAGVAFKLAHAILKRRHPDAAAAREFLKGLLDLVALGTVADMVPLVGENRPMVASGLARMRSAPRTGLLQLLDCAGVPPAGLDTTAISFCIAPRLNAAGRTQHAMYGVELLLTRDFREARDLAHKLENFNDDRRDIEKEILDQALAMIDLTAEDRVIVVAQEGWHAGVLGIVAARILNLYYRPQLIVAQA
ncbi:MAG: single-stranded-DNA-specific exonuclease RecJ, partial [bacterium]|nr:single-stranded-DNA-specific exonuclease RecJ [bacterium]